METDETLPQLEIDALETIAQLVEIPRVTDIQEDENYYQCTYNGNLYCFKKDTASTVEVPASSTDGPKMALTMRHTLDAKFTQDQFANREFFEVMMLHEIREVEYMEAGFPDTHQRAVHDEMLYVIKYLGKSRLKPYLEYAGKYRLEALEKQQTQEAQEEERKRIASQQAEQVREAQLQHLQQETQERAAQAHRDAEESQKEAAIERARRALFYKNRPSLAQFRERATERLPKLSDSFKNAFLRQNVTESDGRGGSRTYSKKLHYLTAWYSPYASKPESAAKVIEEAKGHIRGARYKGRGRERAVTLVDYLNGWRRRDAPNTRGDKRDGSINDRERIEAALKAGSYTVLSEKDAPAQTYALSPDERAHLQDILYLFEVTKRKSKVGITPEFLQHLVLKSDALSEDPSWPNNETFYLKKDEPEAVIATNDQEESEYQAIIAEIASQSSEQKE